MLDPTATAYVFEALWKELEDHHAVAATRRGDTPDKTTKPITIRAQRLNHKL